MAATAKAFLPVFSRVGCPSKILSDRGTQFTSDLVKEVFRLSSVDHLTTSPHHSQTNGMIKRFNGTLRVIHRKMANEKRRDWGRYFPAQLFAYGEMPKERAGFLPFELLYGRIPRGPLTILREVWTGSAAREFQFARLQSESFFVFVIVCLHP